MSMDVSFKAVLFDSDGAVLLGRNRRHEWELLGGRADPADRSPADTIRRELHEEAGLGVTVGALVDIWYYDIAGEGRVAVASYLASSIVGGSLRASDEHAELCWFELDELDDIPLPRGYATTIRLAHAMELPGA